MQLKEIMTAEVAVIAPNATLCEAARSMRSRAAMLDPETHAAVPVEHA